MVNISLKPNFYFNAILNCVTALSKKKLLEGHISLYMLGLSTL